MTNVRDLRVTLNQFSTDRHGWAEIEFETPFGERRRVVWLRWQEAIARASALRRRGYRNVKASDMRVC